MDLKENNFAFFENREGEKYIQYFETDINCIPHFHSSVEINYALSPVTLQHNNKFLKVEKNNFIFNDCFDIHSNENGSIMVLVIPNIYLTNFTNFKKGFKLKDFLFNDSQEEFFNLIIQFKQINTKNKLEIQGLVDYLLGKILSKTKLIRTQSIQDSPLICKIIKYLNQNYKQKVTLTDLSKEFGYSKSQISHTIGEYLNCNLATYLNRIRLIRYVELTKNNTEKTITNCHECGFDSLQTFYRNFKKEYKVSPFNYFKK